MGASPLLTFIQKNGRTPPVGLVITPLDTTRDQISVTKFLTYKFEASVLIPIDAFSFTFSLPGGNADIDEFIQEGDIAELTANGETVCTGIIDVVDVETTLDGGTVVMISGRNVLGQLEDQCAVNTSDLPMYFKSISLASAAGNVIQNTRVRGLAIQGSPSGIFEFATEPGETKLDALQRFVEPLNCVIWSDPQGYLIVGRPNMGAAPSGDLYCDVNKRISNVMSIKAVRASTQIPNVMIPIWTGQEAVTQRVSAEQRILNPAQGPKRLRLAGQILQRAVVTSMPSGSDAGSASDINRITVGGSNQLQLNAIREMQRENVKEIEVQVNVKGHYNDDLMPFLVDQVYNINYPAAGVTEKMYLYQVEYSLDASKGPRTSLYFCRLGCIVAGLSTSPITRTYLPVGELAF
jgi:prophage tail gpP-like protein